MNAVSDTAGDDNRAFLDRTADRLAALPAVKAVTLGGSRAQGTERPDSDWDLAVYYEAGGAEVFDPADLRAEGWPGEVSEIGGWGGGVFNGGAWLTIEGRHVDVHYRDLAVVEHELAEAEKGRFHLEPLMFHLAGIPSYLVVAELGINRVLRGELPSPDYPAALRETAPERWLGNARMTLGYTKASHVPYGRLTEVVGNLAIAATQTAHAVLAARGEWVTNEKTLLRRAGLRDVDMITSELSTDPGELAGSVAEAEALFASVSAY